MRASADRCLYALFVMRGSTYMPVMSPPLHVTHGPRVGLHVLPPQEHGSSLSELHDVHLLGQSGQGGEPVASKNCCQNVHWAGFTRPQGESGAVEHDTLHAARLGYFAGVPCRTFTHWLSLTQL